MIFLYIIRELYYIVKIFIHNFHLNNQETAHLSYANHFNFSIILRVLITLLLWNLLDILNFLDMDNLET